MRILKHREKLSTNHIPEMIPHRWDDLQELADALRPALRERGGPAIAICIGPEGSGKTVIAEHLGRYMRREADDLGVDLLFKRIPCRVERRPSDIIRDLAASVDPLLPLRGLPLSEILSSALRSAEKEERRILLVLDDVDLLLELHPETIYLFTRMGEVIPEGYILSLLFTLRSLEALQKAKPPILSPLRRALFALKDYTQSQRREILEYRVREAFYPGTVSEKALDIVAERGSNIRFSLELLLRAGEVAEDEESLVLAPDHILKAEEDIFPGFSHQDLLEISLHEKLILMAAASLLESSPTNLVGMGELEERYKGLCQEYQVSFIGHTWLWRSIDLLARLGFLSKELSGRGRRGRTTLIGLPRTSPRSLLKRLRSLLGP